MKTKNSYEISTAIRKKILEHLGNSSLTSREVGLLVDEMGELVVSLQTLFSMEIARSEKRISTMIDELSAGIDETLAAQQPVNVTVNGTVDTQKVVNEVVAALTKGERHFF